jgi:hypothetical protein
MLSIDAGAVHPLRVPAAQFCNRYIEQDLDIAWEVLAVPTVYLVAKRDRRANHGVTLARNESAESGIRHGEPLPGDAVIDTVRAEGRADLVSVKQDRLTPLTA